MARKAAHIAVLQAGPGHVSFVRAGGAGGVTEQAVERGAWSLEDGSLAAALGEFARKHLLAQDRVFLVLPRHEVAVRILELPSQDANELRGMVHLGAEEIIPFPLDELLTSYCVIERLEGGSSRVLAVVARRAVVEGYVALLRGAGIVPEQIYLSTSCMLTALAGEDAAVLHVAPDGIEIAVLREGLMVFGRGVSITVAGTGGVPDEASMEEIAAEVRGSLAASRRESAEGAAPSELLVSTEAFDGDAIASALGRALNLSARTAATDRTGSLVAAGALATARGDRRFAVELLPESEVHRQSAAATRARGLRVAAALAVAVAATAALYAQTVSQRKAYLRDLDLRAEQLRPTAHTLRTKRQQLQLIEKQVHRQASPIEILATLASLAPGQGLNVTRFAYDQAEGVTLNGSAVDPKLFDGLIDAIRAQGAASLPQLARVQESYRTERRERNRTVWDFEVTIPFPEAADE